MKVISHIIILIFGSVALVGCTKHNKANKLPLPQIPVSDVEYTLIPNRMEFIGETSSSYDVTIQPRVNGYIASIHYRKGMPVKRGALLFTIDPNQIQTQVASAQAALASSRAQLIEAENNYNRAVPLSKINAISQSSLDQYAAQYKSAQASLKSAESQLRNAQLEFNYTIIKSPIDGIIGETDLTVGEYVGPGTKFAVLNTVSNIDSICVGVAIPVAEYLKVLKEDSINTPTYDNSRLLNNIVLSLADGSEYPYQGRYRYTQRDVGASMGTITIMTIFPNPDRLLKTGQYAKITTNVGADRMRIVVPQVSVTQSQGVNSVWTLAADSTVHFQKVTLGRTFDNKWIVTEGLKPGDKVLTSGQLKIREGMKIIPVNAK